MVKLSDALRGMADRAPLDEATVSTHAAAAKVRQRRALRGTANGLVGVGAAAVLAFAIIVPSTSNPGDAEPDAAGMAEAPGPDGAEADFAADSRLAFGFCGGYVPPTDDSQPGTLDVTGPDEELLEPGTTASYGVTLTVDKDLSGALAGPALYVVWNEIVVGTASGALAEAEAVSLAAGDAVTAAVDLPLVNCWDGEPLPGGTYQVIATQELFPAAVSPEPAPEPEPALEPEPAPAPGETELLIDPAQTSVGGDDPVTSDGGTTGSGVVDYDGGYLFSSARTVVTISGDVPDDPFGVYLNPPAPELPEDYLTVAQAREMYEASLINGVWDMAAGTQRVVMTGDSAVTDGTLWEQNYYGCSWDGGPARPFTTESAELPLLAVEGTVPSRIAVSYGWVVEDNPEVALLVTNVSGHSLPAMYEPNPTLVLVQDGVVVAEAYLSNANRNQVYDYDAAYFEADSVVDGTYLWRDVTGCWANDQSQPVEAGTYTVLNAQYLYLSDYPSGVVAYGVEEQMRSSEGDGVASDSGAESAAVDPAIAPDMIYPAPGGDFLEFQIWTSFGTVTITD